MSLDTLKISLVDSVSANKFNFNFTITNNGTIPIEELKLSTSNQPSTECPIPILDYHISFNSLETGQSYTGSFVATIDQSELLCFYVSSPSAFSDSYYEDNYKCYSGDITSTLDLSEQPILIYPNPVFDVLYIDNYHGQITIYNAKGELVSKPIVEEKVDVSSLPNGLYLLKLDNSQNVRFVKY